MRTLSPYWQSRRRSSPDLFDEIGRFFDEIVGGGRSTVPSVADETGQLTTFAPFYDIEEADDHYSLNVDLPGVKPEDIKIDVNNNMLTISAERKRESRGGDKGKEQSYSRSYGFFQRSFALPPSVDSDQIEANYEDGVLKLWIPKAKSSRARNIQVQAGKRQSSEQLNEGQTH